MDDKPKIITRLAWLWLVLGVLFIISLCLVSFLSFNVLKEGNPDTNAILYGTPTAGSSLYEACMVFSFIIIIFLLLFAVFSFKQWHSVNKGKKLAIKRSLILSAAFLPIWACATTFVIYLLIVSIPNITTAALLWVLAPSILSCSILIVDIAIISVSKSPSMKEFLKTQ